MKHIAQLIRLPETERTVLGRSIGGREISVELTARLRHTAIVGATGMGKSTLMRSMIRQDIARGDGVLIIDPHGTLAADVLRLVPQHRYNHVCLIDLSDAEVSVGFNLVAHPLHRTSGRWPSHRPSRCCARSGAARGEPGSRKS